ncbi:unnamed protein product [Trypanosoma congolense IL3000]|uniref:WGS project CAEQ00000000 data, annotated contig 1711 n=1 Tax=Trypanosoma congolense (strain IL3000) TaxID=1068625 RepID=F9W871_TRYCI|nr:unnamed protein product [Trypanosoma congolense IL3000]
MHYASNYNTPLAGSLMYLQKEAFQPPRGDPVAPQSSHGPHNAGPVWMCNRDKSAGQALGFKTMIPPPVPYTEALQRLTRAGTPNPAAVLTRILHRWYEMVQSVQCELHRLNPSDAYGDGSSEVDATPHGLCPPMPTEAEPERIAEWAASCEEWWKAKFSGRPRFHGRHRAGASGNGHCARTGELRRGFTRRRSDDAPSGAEQRKD